MKEEIMTKVLSFMDNRLAIIEDLQSLNSEDVVKLESHVTVLCLRGKASLYINGEAHEIKANDLLICHPNIILEKSMVSFDFFCRCIIMSPEYIRQLAMLSNDSWEVKKFLENTPVLSLSEEEVGLLCHYYDLLYSKLIGKKRTHQRELIDSLFQAFLYEFTDILERFISVSAPTYTTSETIFRDFIDLLTATYPKERRVSFYADKLNITPKYLSVICKKVAGQTASDLIDKYVMNDIQYLLKKQNISIKEIVNEQNFPNISFFGKFVKKHLGVSPKMYREQLADMKLSVVDGVASERIDAERERQQ